MRIAVSGWPVVAWGVMQQATRRMVWNVASGILASITPRLTWGGCDQIAGAKDETTLAQVE